MPFSTLIGNERIKKLLRRAVAEGRIGQSLLMAGPRGVGKYRFAIALAQALNCESVTQGDACGACVSCVKIASAEHGDVQTVTNDGQFIKIEQMRSLSRDAQFKPYEGRHRVLIIDEADRMNASSANSILKTLEEPPSSTLMVLVSSKPYALLETIRSRCQMLNFAPLTSSEIEAHLSIKDMPPDEARLRAQLSQGSIGRALEIDMDEYRETRARMLELVETLSLSREISKLLSASEYLGRKLEKEEFVDHMDTLIVLLSDLFKLKLNAGPEIVNIDASARLKRISEHVSLDQISSWLDRIEEMFFALPRNVNRQLSMDSMLIAGLIAG